MLVGSVSHGCTARDEEADQYLRQIKSACVWTVGGVEGTALSVCVFTQTCSSIGRLHNFSSLILMAIHWAHEKNTGLVYFSVCVGWICCFALATQELLDSPIFILKMSLFWRMCHATAPHISLLSSLWNTTQWWETRSPIFLRASLDSQLAHVSCSSPRAKFYKVHQEQCYNANIPSGLTRWIVLISAGLCATCHRKIKRSTGYLRSQGSSGL